LGAGRCSKRDYQSNLQSSESRASDARTPATTSFGYEHSRATRTAYEAYTAPQGVCRDFAHLAITFCRCLNIPARYCTGYVSDIGLPPPYAPMDFAAWMEVYLGGRWHTFDPRNNAPRIGRILIAYGRDAADVPITHIFGPGELRRFQVWTDEVINPSS
jgi:transglutaminase-like putative cysteine protease